MCELIETELNILAIMYEGDKSRDATSKIRGFLYQDYILIDCLLEENVKYVCSEYLEDIDVFFDDGTFEMIQVKYYPKSRVKMLEISRDLYYQYLRLKLLHSKLKVVPKLCVHSEEVGELKYDEMEQNVNIIIKNKIPDNVNLPNSSDSVDWLRTKVYIKGKKEDQQLELLKNYASKETLKEFVEMFRISKEENFVNYKSALIKKLFKAYPNTDENREDEHWKSILLGLAVSYVQKRYLLDASEFDQIRIDKIKFNEYMKDSVSGKSEESIINYLVGVVCGVYENIVDYNELSKIQLNMLTRIFRNTVLWVREIGKDALSQQQLVYTCSDREFIDVKSYSEYSIEKRFSYITETKSFFENFIKYLWKIMLNICQENINCEDDLSNKHYLFDLNNYLDKEVTDYICLKFDEDKFAKHSVILPPGHGGFKGIKRKIIQRMINASIKPKKWFFETNQIIKGKNYYNYKTANVCEKPTVADFEREDIFYIECMECIKIDEGEWSIYEDCKECIFAETCKKEGKEK